MDTIFIYSLLLVKQVTFYVKLWIHFGYMSARFCEVSEINRKFLLLPVYPLSILIKPPPISKEKVPSDSWLPALVPFHKKPFIQQMSTECVYYMEDPVPQKLYFSSLCPHLLPGIASLVRCAALALSWWTTHLSGLKPSNTSSRKPSLTELSAPPERYHWNLFLPL